MKKTIQATGGNGTFEGLVEVKLYYRDETIKIHNPSTHEDENQVQSFHIVVGYLPNNETISSKEFILSSDIISVADIIEAKVQERLLELANKIEGKTTKQLLSERGYL